MPQIFQVLKCYKCAIFQVHQTKKDNKWKCKVCGEKQSVKRHYGIGTAKDCRIHVQKLNNMQGNMEESKLKPTDSDSEYEDPTENVNNIQINNTQVLTDSAKKESKWSAYVEKEEILAVNEPEYIDNVEVCLDRPQKRKINRKSKLFKVPKVCNNEDCSKETEIIAENINNLPTFNSDELNSFNFKDNSTDLYYESTIRKQVKASGNKNKSSNFLINKSSKWAQYENSEIDDQCGVIENHENYKKENVEYYNDHKAENVEYNFQKEEIDKLCNDDQTHIIIDDIENRNLCKEVKNDIHHKPMHIFSLCDDNDLDNILEF